MSSETRTRDAGFTLVEALTSTLLTLMVIGGALTMFNGSVRLADTTRIVSETNQVLQVSTSLMVRDFIQAGRGIPLGGIPVPFGGGAAAINRPGPPGLTYPAGTTSLPAVMPGSNIGPVLLGVQTDLINVMYADPTINLSQFPLVSVNGLTDQFRVNAGTNIGGPDGLRVGDLILFTNALGNAVRIITALPGGQDVDVAPGDPLNLNQNGAQGGLRSLESAPNVYPPTTATRLIMVSYYVDNVTDPNLPRLVRQMNGGQRLAIALGVENLQLTYDLVDGVFNPANVPAVPLGNSPNQIRKANVFISARSLDLKPRTRDFYRNSIATEVGFRSLSFVDRYQ